MPEVPVEALRDAIRNLHGCESTFVRTVAVIETFAGKPVWEGDIQIFDLVGHPTANRAYAWSYATEGGKRRFVAVLHVGSVDSPLAAVRAAIVANERATRT